MSTIINGTSSAITFPDSSVQNTSAIVSGYVPYANLPAGSVLQVVNGTTSTQVTTTGTTYIDTGLSASITPKFSTSKILVLVSQNGTGKSTESGGGTIDLIILRNSTQIVYASAAYTGTAIYNICSISESYLDSPTTTSSVTYKTQFKSGASGTTALVQNPSSLSTITLLEIAQ